MRKEGTLYSLLVRTSYFMLYYISCIIYAYCIPQNFDGKFLVFLNFNTIREISDDIRQ